jgi:GAF domain-containing protein
MNRFDENASIPPGASSGRTVAWWGYSPEHIAYVQDHPIPMGRGSTHGRAIAERGPVQIPDVLADADYEAKGVARASGVRTTLAVPLMREGVPIGFITLGRRTARPFTKQQIALVETFADQAVIAIENARLFSEVQARTKELTESLEQQTATSEVLEVISSSPGELQPVFKTMLANATRLCEARFGVLNLYDGEVFRAVATHNVPPAFAELARREPVVRPAPDGVLSRVTQTKQPVHITDIREEPVYLRGVQSIRDLSDVGGVRTMVVVPMLKDNALIGVLTIYRQEVRAFH